MHNLKIYSDEINDENTGCDTYRDGILEVMNDVQD